MEILRPVKMAGENVFDISIQLIDYSI